MSLAISLVLTGAITLGAATAAAAAGTATARYVPVPPTRLLDTRTLPGRPGAAETVLAPVMQAHGVPSDASAAAITVTATDAAAPGFVTVWGDGIRPATSTLNLDAIGDTHANLAIIPIGADGAIRLFTQSGTHLVVDLAGVFVPAATAAGGRLVPLGPARLLDTRLAGGELTAHTVRTIDTTVLGVPRTASAAAIELTGIATDAWFAAWPADTTWPGTSTVHTGRDGKPATASAIVPLTDGRLSLTSSADGDAVIDVTGWFTGADAPELADGLFVPIAPTRVLDTRGEHGTGLRVGPTGSVEIGAFPFSTATASAVAVNVTAVRPAADGFITAFPASSERPVAALANVAARDVLAAGGIVPVSATGIEVYVQSLTHLVVDVTGWFTVAARSLPPMPWPTPSASTAFTMAATHPDGRWARWDPCDPITVLVDFSDATTGARVELDDVVHELRAATGLDLRVVEGHVGDTPVNGAITVRWAPGGSVSGLSGNVIGLGGFGYTTERIVWGNVWIRSDVALGIQPDGDDLLRFVLAHELAHALGLGHIDDRTQLMYPYANGHDHFQDGDLAGLYRLGVSQGCTATALRSIELAPTADPAVTEVTAVVLGPAA